MATKPKIPNKRVTVERRVYEFRKSAYDWLWYIFVVTDADTPKEYVYMWSKAGYRTRKEAIEFVERKG